MRSLTEYESSEEHWAWHLIRPGIGILLWPGGGNLSFELGYRLLLRFFEEDFVADRNNKMSHDIRFINSWKIAPKTALIFKGNFSPIVYFGDDTFNNDSMPVRGLVGIQGLFTPRFGLSLFAGYGASFYEAGEQFSHVIATGQLMFFVAPTANIKLGGQRDFVDSFYSNFFIKNGGYIKYEQMFGGIVLATLKGDIFHRDYSTMAGSVSVNGGTPSSSDRSDIWAGGTLLIEWRAFDWLSFHVSGRYQGNISDFAYQFEPTDNDNDPTTPDVSRPDLEVRFHRFQVFGGVRGHY